MADDAGAVRAMINCRDNNIDPYERIAALDAGLGDVIVWAHGRIADLQQQNRERSFIINALVAACSETVAAEAIEQGIAAALEDTDGE